MHRRPPKCESGPEFYRKILKRNEKRQGSPHPFSGYALVLKFPLVNMDFHRLLCKTASHIMYLGIGGKGSYTEPNRILNSQKCLLVNRNMPSFIEKYLHDA